MSKRRCERLTCLVEELSGSDEAMDVEMGIVMDFRRVRSSIYSFWVVVCIMSNKMRFLA